MKDSQPLASLQEWWLTGKNWGGEKKHPHPVLTGVRTGLLCSMLGLLCHDPCPAMQPMWWLISWACLKLPRAISFPRISFWLLHTNGKMKSAVRDARRKDPYWQLSHQTQLKNGFIRSMGEHLKSNNDRLTKMQSSIRTGTVKRKERLTTTKKLRAASKRWK